MESHEEEVKQSDHHAVRAIDPNGNGREWSMPLPSRQTIISELCYNPRKLKIVKAN